MSDVVFILGAGASAEAGAPLMGNFLDVAFSLWKTGKVKDEEDHFKKVFEAISFLQAVHSKSQLDINNIESVFSTFEMAATLGRFPGVPEFKDEQSKELIDSLKVVIGTTIELTFLVPIKDGKVGLPSPYAKFFSLLRHLSRDAFPNRTISIITFNYDLGCDLALYVNRVPVDYALGEEADPHAVKLLKLHGSLNWFHCPDSERVFPSPNLSPKTRLANLCWTDDIISLGTR